MILTLLFWFLLFILFYTYLGYPALLWLFVAVKSNRSSDEKTVEENFEPNVCLFVTAYNEKDYILQKVENLLDLDYPSEKIQYLWVTDGSDDESVELLRQFSQLEVYHRQERCGKMHAMNRGMRYVKAPIVIFSDSNTILSKCTIREIVKCFSDEKVGCVSGEKRIVNKLSDVAAGAGEGFYWRLESWMKKKDAELNSVVGAAGELFAVRTELFEDVEEDTILDDLIISLRIAQKGYKIAYASEAYAVETASLNVKEELKRKIRIAAGGVQTIFRMKGLLNPLKNGVLSWQYFSHKVLRWGIAPLSFFALLLVNFCLVWKSGFSFSFYTLFFIVQALFFFIAIIGRFFENKETRLKFIFVPYYFLMINYASLMGFFRFFKGKQSAAWEKSERAK